MSWRKLYPNSDNAINEIPAILRDNFDAIEDAYDLEHYSPSSGSAAVSGEHRLGLVGAIYEGTTAQIAALTSPQDGALAYDTTVGVLIRYNGSAWFRIGANYWSRFRAYASSGTAVTSGASAQTLVFDTENYDTLAEYSTTTGIFTALASGYYLLVAQITMAASGTQTTTAVTSAKGTVATTWNVSGAASNLLAIDDYPTANDADFNTTQTCGNTDTFSGTLGAPPAGADPIIVSVRFRSRRRGCVCNNACYGEGCTCNNACYGHTCTCDNVCYGYTACSCDATCYGYGKVCTCDGTCYEYSACSCNFSCYVHTCDTCYNTVYGTAGCTCDVTCYLESETKPTGILRKGGVNYTGSTVALTTAFVDYSESWSVDPATGLAWTPAAVSGIQGFGYNAVLASAGCYADISQCYLRLDWFPNRPVMGLHIYKNNSLYQSTYRPIHESSISPYQVVALWSMLFLVPGDTIKITYTKTMKNDNIYPGTEYTYFALHRLPVDCL